MDRLLFIGMNGVKQTELAQTINANNLANASTAGFRADFQALMAAPVEGVGLDTRSNTINVGKSSDFQSGQIVSTGNPLDVAISGEGFFAVQDSDGNEAYSRRGDFKLTTDGMLLNGAGQPVMGDGGPVAIPEHQSLSIGADGTVSIVPLGLGAETLVTVDRIRLVNPDTKQLAKGDDGLFRLRNGGQADADASVSIRTGHIENSNVNTVDAMVKMISLARQYEMQVKVMSNANTLAETSARLMRIE
ncbi:flagellar basal-body rod protein FlgF [Spongiibacter sp. KMU-158]|uniref:Flagellar basal-body rod protein FlgF n=1 Tax=Spongiibacter pelagi TaxID=2760804 RepID=A0A927C2R7_9GAMM|nr:flagellar basal-body rod protein FlgF [Spongiibacter pelagi]MBD2858415.1 flagellar basal-body rod protein FlgF [Spongiibacter pelagi]